MATAEDVDRKRAEKKAKKQARKEEKRRLAVDEAFEKLGEYHIDRGRVVFIDNNQKRRGGFGVVRQAHLHNSAYVPTWIASYLYGEPQLVAVKQITVPPMQDAWDLKRAFTKEVLVWSRVKDHPGISKFFGFYADFDRREAWLISPWEPFGNVSEFIKRLETSFRRERGGANPAPVDFGESSGA
ncbi:hypothetical protein FS837_003013 [Tulasnella sp. UAMH 9824]|nr:hypothetical protein FS837_003013 [Tulasnella sp. UAMH 9824]